jgi:putative FmdB family regulatory protein
MPTYEYACTSCGQHVEVVQSMTAEPLRTCGACGGQLRKVFSPIGIVFKGSGFYRTDSRAASNGNGRAGTSKEKDAKSQTSSSSDSSSASSKADASGGERAKSA